MSDEQQAFEVLQRRIDPGEIQVGIDVWKVNRPGGPFYSAADNGLPILVLAGAVVYSFMHSWLWGIVSLICSVLLFVSVINKFVFNRARRRITRYVLSDLSCWQEIWEEGCLSLRCSSGGGECYPGRDDWTAFVLEAEKPDA